jgi:hypothetical protein
MAIVIRFSVHRPGDPPQLPPLRTSYSRYLAVDIGEELAALVSLALGIRCVSGGLTREFRVDGDPRGRHLGYEHKTPHLARPPALHGSQLPRVARDASGGQRQIVLEEAVPLLQRYPYASQKKALALVRAARLYAQAIWTADADAQTAWLALVTACEVAAAERYGAYDPKRKARQKRPPQPAARFTNFICRYSPEPPQERPDLGAVDWSQMQSHADWIYHWRSRALHDGIPFPPTTEVPRAYGGNNVPVEAPLGLGSSTGTSSWRREVTPMLLHTFAYIVRSSLIRWWRETRVRKAL